jgi:hypothetical protein
MKKLLVPLIALILTGCASTVPVTMTFPQPPASLMEPAEKLTPLNKKNKVELSDIIENANENAGKYYKLREKYNAWQMWYEEQKKIYESVK